MTRLGMKKNPFDMLPSVVGQSAPYKYEPMRQELFDLCNTVLRFVNMECYHG